MASFFFFFQGSSGSVEGGWWHDNWWHANYWHSNWWANLDAVTPATLPHAVSGLSALSGGGKIGIRR